MEKGMWRNPYDWDTPVRNKPTTKNSRRVGEEEESGWKRGEFCEKI